MSSVGLQTRHYVKYVSVFVLLLFIIFLLALAIAKQSPRDPGLNLGRLIPIGLGSFLGGGWAHTGVLTKTPMSFC